jgi:putative DNA methylase
MTPVAYAKKLIEVAIPVQEISAAAKADKAVKTGTIRNLHKWFAPMPLPAWRALLFAALIDDPADDEKRAYLLDVTKRLVANGARLPDDDTLDEARQIIKDQFPDGVPSVMDPFCGAGSTLTEAQRLGLPTFGSDLNPVPVLITRTLTELLPRVFGKQPLHPAILDESPWSIRKGRRSGDSDPTLIPPSSKTREYTGYDGLIRDVMYYSERICDQAWERLQDYYPGQRSEMPIAWLWARTVACPNPACGIETVLTTSWWLSKKKGDLAWIQPSVEGGQVHLEVISGQRSGEPQRSPKTGDGVFACIACSAVLDGPYLRSEGVSGHLGMRMTAVALEKAGRRVFRAVAAADTDAASGVKVDATVADVPLNISGQGIRVGLYGMDTWRTLYTPRQLLTLATFADLVSDAQTEVRCDGGSDAWVAAVSTMMGLAVGKLAQYGSSQVFLFARNGPSQAKAAFGRNDLPMTWDFVETAVFGDSIGAWTTVLANMMRAIPYAPTGLGVTVRADAREVRSPGGALVATDPPYFDAIGYADLSDYFYLWHRRALKNVHPDLYATLSAPKSGELTAVPSHHGNNKEAARSYFIEGFTETFRNLQESMADGLPMLIVYASKEQKSGQNSEETRWSSILTSMVAADLEITGTWPIHGTTETRMISAGTNAVASYVVMVCRPRPSTAGTCSLADFNRALRRELKPGVRALQAAGILPVDLAQASMGPGMQIYSRYREVVDQSGGRVPVEQALRLINAALGEVLDEQEGELDPDSRFAVTWWDKHGWEPGSFGEADQLARPQGISVDDLIRAGVATYPKPGFVGLLGAGDMDRGWKPSIDSRPTAWEALHHLADRLIDGGGELAAGRLMGELAALRDPAQALVYRLHDIAARKGRTKDQERYNALIGSWADLLVVAGQKRDGELF